MDWNAIFDGIGTEIIVAIIGLFVGALGGGAVGYRIGIKNKNKQKQKARDNVNQNQVGTINIIPTSTEKKDE